MKAIHAKPSLLLPFNQDNTAITAATHANEQHLLLPFNQGNSANMMKAAHENPSLLPPFDQDNSANMTTANHAHLLLSFIQDNSANTITAARANLLLLHCVQDDSANTMASHAKLKLQLIVEFIPSAFDAHIQETIIAVLNSEGESDGCKLIVNYNPILHSKATRNNFDSKISFHFCNDCRIFCEGEWAQP